MQIYREQFYFCLQKNKNINVKRNKMKMNRKLKNSVIKATVGRLNIKPLSTYMHFKQSNFKQFGLIIDVTDANKGRCFFIYYLFI